VTGSAGDDRIIELTETAEKTGTLVRVTERHSVALLGRLFDRLRLAGGSTPVFLQDLARWLGGDRPLIASQP